MCREDDSIQDIKRKLRLATILGTIQSTLTDFRYLSKRWQTNCEEERLLGVSLTGIQDNPTLACGADQVNLEEVLKEFKDYAISTNARWARELGIPASASITCVKPSGTVSQLTNSSSGIHPRYSQYYIRRVRQSKTDPISRALIEAGVPHETDATNETQWIFDFPIKSPDECITVDRIGAIEQLEHWKVFDQFYCEHKPSVSIYCTDREWLDVGAWVYRNFEAISGESFHAWKLWKL